MKLHPELREKWKALGSEVHRELFKASKRMCLPFWWHGPTPNEPQIFNNGTLCLLDTGERILGVTAWHVYEKYMRRRQEGRPFVCQFGSVTVTPEKLLIDEDKELDLVTFDLSELIGQFEGFAAHRPSVWPPARAAVRELVVYGGFPGNTRYSDLELATFSFDTVTSLVSDVTERNIAVHVDYRRLHDADGPAGNLGSSDPCGTSGGPVYRITNTALGHVIEIVGFVYAQSELAQSVLARHADAIEPNGRIGYRGTSTSGVARVNS